MGNSATDSDADKAHAEAVKTLKELCQQVEGFTADQGMQLAIVTQLNAIRAELRARR